MVQQPFTGYKLGKKKAHTERRAFPSAAAEEGHAGTARGIWGQSVPFVMEMVYTAALQLTA